MTLRTALYCVVGVLIASTLRPHFESAQAERPETCLQNIASSSAISRDQLAAFIELRPGAQQATIQATIGQPYCLLAPKDGYQREAYPLRFDGETWLIVAYSGTTYNSYTFTFHNGR
jgi:hypothetical protein